MVSVYHTRQKSVQEAYQSKYSFFEFNLKTLHLNFRKAEMQ